MNFQDLGHDIHGRSEGLRQQDKPHTLISQPPYLPCMAGPRSCSKSDGVIVFVIFDRTGF